MQKRRSGNLMASVLRGAASASNILDNPWIRVMEKVVGLGEVTMLTAATEAEEVEAVVVVGLFLGAEVEGDDPQAIKGANNVTIPGLAADIDDQIYLLYRGYFCS